MIDRITYNLAAYDPLFEIVAADDYLVDQPEIRVVSDPETGWPVWVYRSGLWSAVLEVDAILMS